MVSSDDAGPSLCCYLELGFHPQQHPTPDCNHRFIDDEAEHSGSGGDERDDIDESDPTLGGFIVDDDNVSDSDEDSDSGNGSDNSDVSVVAVTRTRSGRDVQAPLRFDAMVEHGQHCRE